MKKLEIGIPGEAWKSYEDKLLDAIKSLFGGHLPYTYSPGEVVDELNSNYKTNRTDESLYQEIKKLLNNVGGVFKPFNISEDKKYVLVQEYADSKYLDKRLFAKKLSKENRVISEISIRKKGKQILYILPSVLDADYGVLFSTVFKVSHFANNSFQNDVNRMFKIDNEKRWISIPIKGQNEKLFDKLLNTAVWFLLDLLLSKLTENLANSKRSRGKKSQQLERGELRNQINQVLFFFEEYGYAFSRKSKLIKSLNTRTIPIESYSDEVELLFKIMKASNSETIKIPEYTISTWQLFELFVYSDIYSATSLRNPGLTIEYKPSFGEKKEKEKKKKMEKTPDIFFSHADNDAGIIDAKYKFQYGKNAKYCEIEDVNRMFNYLIFKEQERPGCQAKGLFCYPTLQENPVSISDILQNNRISDLFQNNRIAKVCISLPVKKTF